LNEEQMLKTLEKLGFTETEAKVYVFLTTEGPQKAKTTGEALNLRVQQLYRILKNLLAKGIINASPEYPARYSAVQFEKVIDLLIKIKIEQQQALQQNKEELLYTWQSITKKTHQKS
jgi:sugar-specific transcriptional regulator TrmB